MRIGEAIAQARNGKRIARLGWNGKGMYVYMTKGRLLPIDAWEVRTPSQELTAIEIIERVTRKTYVGLAKEKVKTEGMRSLKDRNELEGADMNSVYPKVVN